MTPDPKLAKCELKPCPFCGNKQPEIVDNNIGDYYVICNGDDGERYCGASSSDNHCETEEGAIKRWNTRVEAGEALPMANEIASELTRMAASENADGEPYDTMQAAAVYIRLIESQLAAKTAILDMVREHCVCNCHDPEMNQTPHANCGECSKALLAEMEAINDSALKDLEIDYKKRLAVKAAELETVKKILAHVPGKIALKAKEDAGYGVEIKAN